MGEVADAMLEGEVCEGCGEWFHDEAPGYPRRCSACSSDPVGPTCIPLNQKGVPKKLRKVMWANPRLIPCPAPECHGRKFQTPIGIAQHILAKHDK